MIRRAASRGNAAFGPAGVFANHAYYGIVRRVHDLLNFPAVRLPIIREVAVLMAHYSQVRPFVSTAISRPGRRA